MAQKKIFQVFLIFGKFEQNYVTEFVKFNWLLKINESFQGHQNDYTKVLCLLIFDDFSKRDTKILKRFFEL